MPIFMDIFYNYVNDDEVYKSMTRWEEQKKKYSSILHPSHFFAPSVNVFMCIQHKKKYWKIHETFHLNESVQLREIERTSIIWWWRFENEKKNICVYTSSTKELMRASSSEYDD